MIIGYDARLINKKRTGTATMQEQILYQIIQCQEHKFIIFGNIPDLEKYKIFENVELVQVNMKKNQLWEQCILPIYMFFKKIDVFYSAKNITVPFLYKHKTLCSILDLIPYHYPHVYLDGRLKKLYYKLLLKLASKAKSIVTISNYSMEDIKRYIPNAQTVFKIPLGANEPIKIFNTNTVVIEQPYFLSVGGAEPRKNNQTLINAFAQFKKSGLPHKLVIVGGEEWNGYQLEVPMNLKDDVIVYEYIEDEELEKLLRGATAFVCPSISEGFGLPVLEAILYGLPTIVAKNTSLEELYSQSSYMVETMNPHSYASALMEVASGSDCLEFNYKELLEYYNWSNSANTLMQIIEELFGKGK